MEGFPFSRRGRVACRHPSNSNLLDPDADSGGDGYSVDTGRIQEVEDAVNAIGALAGKQQGLMGNELGLSTCQNQPHANPPKGETDTP